MLSIICEYMHRIHYKHPGDISNKKIQGTTQLNIMPHVPVLAHPHDDHKQRKTLKSGPITSTPTIMNKNSVGLGPKRRD